jgi:flagellar protein FliL
MATETAAPPKSGKKGLVLLILIALIAVAGGATLPWVLGGSRSHATTEKKKTEAAKIKQTAIFFDTVRVNLPEERLNRFLIVKIMVAVEESEAKEITEHMEKQKAFLKNRLISYLSDQSMHEVTRQIGVNRIRREIRDEFNAILYPEGEEKILDVLFDEFVVQ